MTVYTWAPGLVQIGAYITSRTLDASTPGSDTPTGTFSEDTYPTDSQVEQIVPGACGWVSALTGTIDPSLTDLATSVAALRVAALVELSFPIRDADITNAEQLLTEATNARADLAAANVAITGTNPHVAPLVPEYSMPCPVYWGDYTHLGS